MHMVVCMLCPQKTFQADGTRGGRLLSRRNKTNSPCPPIQGAWVRYTSRVLAGGVAGGWRCLALLGKERCAGAQTTLLALTGKGAAKPARPDCPLRSGNGRRFVFSFAAGQAGAPGRANGTIIHFAIHIAYWCPPAGGTAGFARTHSRDKSLENPIGCRALSGALHPSRPKRRRRAAPTRGPSAVYPRFRPNRNETKRPCPLLVGHGRVAFEPKALAGGTAAPP